jgi:hypothetical protein
MFTDPQSITVDSVEQTLARISSAGATSVYREDVGEFSLRISHEERKKGRNKRFISVMQTKVAADPFNSSINQEYIARVSFKIDAPVVGYTAAELEDLSLALAGWLTSANVLKVLGGET